MYFLRRLSVHAALGLALLLGLAAPGLAQATPIANGHLTGGPIAGAPNPTIIDLTFSLVERPDGSLVGSGFTANRENGSWFMFDLTSYVLIGDTLYAAGPITATHNIGAGPQVGDTYFMAVIDNGNGPVADEFIQGRVPSIFGPLTIQQILAIVGPPAPGSFRQGINGNLTIH